MMPMVILVGFVAVPVVVLWLLRVNAALVFLSLCLGALLVQFVGNDAVSIVSGASVNAHTTSNVVKLILLLAPALLTTLFMLRTVSGHKRILNVFPALGVGSLAALLAVPLLSPGLAATITRSVPWRNVQAFQSGIVALGALVCLLFLWFVRPKNHNEKHGKKHAG